MKKSNYFNFNRLFMLMYRQLRLKFNSILITTGAFAGIIIVVNLLSMFSCHCNEICQQLYSSLSLPMFFVLGMVFTSKIFDELHSPSKSCFYLTLPVSNTERLAASWLLSSVIYLIWWILAIFIINILISVLGFFLLNISFSWINMFSRHSMTVFGSYMVTQSVFLFGAIYFRKNNLIKTVFALFLIGLAISMLTSFSGLLIFGHGMNFSITNESNISDSMLPYFINLGEVMKYLYWIGVLPFFLLLSYISLKERQV